jgi:hypothetical protein
MMIFLSFDGFNLCFRLASSLVDVLGDTAQVINLNFSFGCFDVRNSIYEHSDQTRAPNTYEPRGVSRCGALSLLKSLNESG